ncbi:MAG: hypothetical protein LBK05_10325, partial [Treponema sp.]|nr:hypothetical protein [Treponema sp.]
SRVLGSHGVKPFYLVPRIGTIKRTFVSGGTQPGRIRNILGSLSILVHANGSVSIISAGTGAFYIDTPVAHNPVAFGSGSVTLPSVIKFDASRYVSTGPDVAPSHFSKRLWRRVS